MSDKPRTLVMTVENAFQLCHAAANKIEAKPKTYNQSCWGMATEPGPGIECGTIACRAGQMVWMHDGVGMYSMTDTEIRDRAWELLGDDAEYCGEYGDIDTPERKRYDFRLCIRKLFSGSLPGVDRFYPGDLFYAKLGADGLREFANKWQERLTAVRTPRILEIYDDGSIERRTRPEEAKSA